MIHKNVLSINDAELDSIIQSDTLVLVDFWAPWCGPCRALSPMLEELAVFYTDNVKICKLNIDENSQAPTRYSIKTIPTLILFKKGEIVDRWVGSQSKEAFIAALDKHLL